MQKACIVQREEEGVPVAESCRADRDQLGGVIQLVQELFEYDAVGDEAHQRAKVGVYQVEEGRRKSVTRQGIALGHCQTECMVHHVVAMIFCGDDTVCAIVSASGQQPGF